MNADEFSNTDVEIGSATMTLGRTLGSGKEGTVYAIQGARQKAVKIFDEGRRADKRSKIREMIRNPPDDLFKEVQGEPRLIWPQKPVRTVESSEFLGYAMLRIDTNDLQDAQKYASEKLDHSESSAKLRYLAAADLAFTIALVHQHGHALGDMHERNILVNTENISLIDCDSFHIRGKYRSFGGSTIYPRYAVRDSRNKDDPVAEIQQADRFGLAVHIFQFLMGGQHPFVAVGEEATTGSTEIHLEGNQFPYHDPKPERLEPPDGVPDYTTIPRDIRDLFKRAFIDGKTRPRHRPKAIKWAKVLARVGDIDIEDGQSIDIENDKTRDPTEWRERQRAKRRRIKLSSEPDTASKETTTENGGTSTTAQSTSDEGTTRTSGSWVDEIREDSRDEDNSFSETTSSTGTRHSNLSTTKQSSGTRLSPSTGAGAGKTSPLVSADGSGGSGLSITQALIILVSAIITVFGFGFALLIILINIL